MVRKKCQVRPEPPPPFDTVPPWLPVGDHWDALPEVVRLAVPRIIVPAYQQFVLDVNDQLKRSAGLTLVHLLWLEICDQIRLAEAVANPESPIAILNSPEEMISRYLNIVSAKNQTAELLVKIRLVSEALARSTVTLPHSPTFLPLNPKP